MDLGFIDKFEEHWGKGLTKALLGFAALVAITAGLGIAWAFFAPIFDWAQNTAEGAGYTYLAVKALTLVTAVGVVFSTGTVLSQMISTRAREREFNAEMDKIFDSMTVFAATMDQAASIQEESKAIYEEAAGILASLKDQKTKERLESVQVTLAQTSQISIGMRNLAAETRMAVKKMKDRLISK